MPLIRLSVLAIALAWQCQQAFCQQPATPRYQHYDVNDGLVQNSVWQILQDSSGYMWFVTSGGLCRFDGEQFQEYKNIPGDTNSLYSNHINSIAQARNGDLWIGCFGGLCRLGYVNNRMERAFSIPKSTRFNYHILGISADTLWCWAENSGVYGINTTTGKIANFLPIGQVQPQPADECLSIVAGPGSDLYLAYSKSGLVRLNRQTLSSEPVYARPLHHEGARVFMACLGHFVFFMAADIPGVLQIYNTVSHTLQPCKIGNLTATDVIISGSKLLLATKENSMLRIDTNACSAPRVAPEGIEKTPLNGALACLYTDRSGVLWVGTDGMGIYKNIPNYRGFRHYNSATGNQKLVKSIFTSDSFVYACTFNNYIDVYHENGRFARQIKGCGSASFRSVVANAVETNRSLWLAGVDCFGLYDLSANSFTDYLQALRRLAGEVTTEAHFCALHKQNPENLWVGFGYQLFRLSHSVSGSYVPALARSFTPEKITSIASCGHTLAVGTAGKLQLYNCTTNTWAEPLAIPTDLVKCLYFESDSTLWIGTENGLFRYNPWSRSLRHLDEKAGLPNSFIYGIVSYGKRMWISSNRGLSCFEPGKNEFRNYTVEDGLQSNEFNTGAYHISSREQIYFGGPNGVNGFHDSDIKDNPFAPAVQFTGIRLFDEPYKTDTAYNSLCALVLPYNQNTLSFEFIALEYSNPGLNQYAYKMQGVDKNWIYSGYKHFARYAGLPAGNYQFMVKASNHNGTWQKAPRILAITINPPFWERGWFITLLVITGAAIVAMAVFLIQRQQHRKKLRRLELEQKIQRERERISRDLHDNVGSQISYLVSNIDWINRHKVADEEQYARLDNLSAAAQNMMGQMRETIWTLNKTEISLEELSDKLKAYVQQQLRYNEKIKFVVEERIETAHCLAPGMALNIFRICQEAASNAIKHSGTEVLEIKVISNKPGEFEIQIIDKGIGFATGTANRAGHYGLENMRLRAAESGATLEVRSAHEAGTSVILKMKT